MISISQIGTESIINKECLRGYLNDALTFLQQTLSETLRIN